MAYEQKWVGQFRVGTDGGRVVSIQTLGQRVTVGQIVISNGIGNPDGVRGHVVAINRPDELGRKLDFIDVVWDGGLAPKATRFDQLRP